MSSVHDFGARGDGKADDTNAIRHAVDKSDGVLFFPRGDYIISRTLQISLAKHGRLSIHGPGARVIMKGAGPAFRLIGTHGGTALPKSFDAKVWQRERFPLIEGIGIVGAHAQADGFRVEGVMQPTFTGVLIRRCRHGIQLFNRNRNVVISNCHIYDNSGVGVFLDHVNLHQIIIEGNHISYCKQGGIKIANSEIRNIQICSNDIEYNFDKKADTSNDVLLDCREGTIREGTLVGNTIQAVESPGGANVRLLGAKDHPNAVGLFTITGNLIGSEETAIDLRSCRGVVVSGNCIYGGYRAAVWIEDSEHVVVGSNTIDHNPEYRGKSTDRVVIRKSRNINVNGVTLQHTLDPTEAVESTMEITDSENVSVTGCQIINARVRGIQVNNCSTLRVADCTIRGKEKDAAYRAAVTVDNKSKRIMVSNCFLARGEDGALLMPKEAGVQVNNMILAPTE